MAQDNENNNDMQERASLAPKAQKKTRKVNYHIVDKWIAGISLVYFIVIMIAGFIQDAGVVSITKRAMIAILTLVLIKIIFVKILANYEEMNSD